MTKLADLPPSTRNKGNTSPIKTRTHIYKRKNRWGVVWSDTPVSGKRSNIIDKKLAYISDVSKIFEKDYKHFKNLKYLIIDCLWYRYHPSHFNLDKSLEMIKKFSPKKAILTNLHTDIDYNEIKKKLPRNIVPGYDGLSVIL